MMRWVVGSNLHDAPIELFVVPASAPHQGVTKTEVRVILSVG